LAALEIPYRRIYNTRHTYAVLSLDANDKLSNISKSMGHASMQMVMEVYSKPADEDPEDTNFASTFDM
jgi:integrase